MLVTCPACGTTTDYHPDRYACACGSPWEPAPRADFDPTLIDTTAPGLWRYRRLLGPTFESPRVSMGEGWTPIVAGHYAGRDLHVKLEYLMPTGSFKDRGVAVMINAALAAGRDHVIEDSSGNAGAAVAAYAARAGIRAEIYVPAYASPAKQAQIALYGAQVVPVEGPRIAAKEAALKAVDSTPGATLAAHAYHPSFLLGQQTTAWEIWEQWRALRRYPGNGGAGGSGAGGEAPDWIIVPVGQGLHLLGLWLGFRRLQAAGLIERLPRLVAAQAAKVAPLAEAWEAGLDHTPGVEPPATPTLAEGIAINAPLRGVRLIEALRETGGMALAASERAIQAAQTETARQGFYIEPTSACALAVLPALLPLTRPTDRILVNLTGSGLKGKPQVERS